MNLYSQEQIKASKELLDTAADIALHMKSPWIANPTSCVDCATFFDNINNFDALHLAFKAKPWGISYRHPALNFYAEFFLHRFSSPFQNNLWDQVGVRARVTADGQLIDDAGKPIAFLILSASTPNEMKHQLSPIADMIFQAKTDEIPAERRLIMTMHPNGNIFTDELKAGYQQALFLTAAQQRRFIELDQMFFSDLKKELKKKVSRQQEIIQTVEAEWRSSTVAKLQDILSRLLPGV